MELYDFHFDGTEHKEEPLVLMPLGDIQWTGDPNDVASTLLKERIDLGLKLNAFFIGMGDYIDYASPSNRQRIRSANLYDNALKIHENAAMSLVDELYEKFLKPTRGRWLGLLEGHHYTEFANGMTSDMYLAQMLETLHLGTTAFLGLHFDFGQRHRHTVNIWGTHGIGSGVKLSAPINKLEQIASDIEADVYLIGHMTKQAVVPLNRIYPVWGSQRPFLRHTVKLLTGTGGFGKSYIEHSRQGIVPRGNYVERGMMRPAALGNPIIRIKPRRVSRRIDGKHISWYTSEITGETGG